MSNVAWNKELRAWYAANAHKGLVFTNLNSLHGSIVYTGQPVITNNASQDPRSRGVPKGHPPIEKFFGIPLFTGASPRHGKPIHLSFRDFPMQVLLGRGQCIDVPSAARAFWNGYPLAALAVLAGSCKHVRHKTSLKMASRVFSVSRIRAHWDLRSCQLP